MNVAGRFRQFCGREAFQFFDGCFKRAHYGVILTRQLRVATVEAHCNNDRITRPIIMKTKTQKGSPSMT